MNNIETFERLESNVRMYCRDLPLVFDTAQGSRIRGEDGREYLDFFAGAGALNYGHNDPRMRDALIAYLSANGVTHALDLHHHQAPVPGSDRARPVQATRLGLQGPVHRPDRCRRRRGGVEAGAQGDRAYQGRIVLRGLPRHDRRRPGRHRQPHSPWPRAFHRRGVRALRRQPLWRIRQHWLPRAPGQRPGQRLERRRR